MLWIMTSELRHHTETGVYRQHCSMINLLIVWVINFSKFVGVNTPYEKRLQTRFQTSSRQMTVRQYFLNLIILRKVYHYLPHDNKSAFICQESCTGINIKYDLSVLTLEHYCLRWHINIDGVKLRFLHKGIVNSMIIPSNTETLVLSSVASVLSSGSRGGPRGPGPPLDPKFEAPDYILRPKLHLLTHK